ncbi:MAG TPA: aldolase/citrate lyase family protein [Acetobacteraceae bacterium]|jgi:2-keto-3-deoxy-L-rhamnonate aldolase RhmA|nr:aldolase/citrate lyase family protein [Acetobacteraceae bacterium]
MGIVRNTAKRKLAEGGIALGFGVHHLRTTAVPMLAIAGGHDFLFIDMEHGATTVQEATQICIAALPTGVPAIVRVCAGALDEATRLLDNGALGIVVPHVDTAKQAQRIADAFHYPPAGTRSWGGPPPIYGYMPPHVAEAQKAVNDEILTVVMIESPEAVENAGDIAAVDGIDVLFIGSFDLTSALGIAGQMGHRKLIDAYDEVGKACAKHGKVLGMGGINGDEDSERYIGMGSRFITTGSDHSYVVAGSLARATFLRGLTVGGVAKGKKKGGKKKALEVVSA